MRLSVLALTGLVASIAVADSLNPSTVVPALYLAGRQNARSVASFTAGVFAVYLLGGLVLVLGPGPDLIAALRHVGPGLEHAVEAGVGAALLLATAAYWLRRRRAAVRPAPLQARSRRAPFALGAGITAIELPTAFMYFCAVAAILDSSAPLPLQVLLVITYNALFVLPLVAVFALRALMADGAAQRLRTVDRWMRRCGPIAVSAVACVAGLVLAGAGVGGMLSS